MNTKRTALLFVVMIGAASLVYSLTNIAPGFTRENIGMAVEFNDHSAAAWIALRKGLFREMGLNISSFTTFRTGLALAAALYRDDIQAAWVCLGPGLVAIDRGIPIKVVAMAHLHGYSILVSPKSNISKVSGLKGKTIAVPGPGSPAWLLLRMVLDEYNIGLGTIKMKKMPPDIGTNALTFGLVDAAALPEPYVSIAESRGAKVLVRSQDIWSNMPGSVLVVKESFLTEHPDAVIKLIRVDIKGVKYIRKHFNVSASIVAASLGVEAPIVERSMQFLSYEWNIDLIEVQRYIDLLKGYGAIEGRFKAAETVDLEFLGEAVKAEGAG